MILSEAWNLYKADKQIQACSPQTLKAYNVQLNLLIRHLGDVSLDEITTDSLKLYLGKVADQLKAASLGHRIRFIKSLFRWTPLYFSFFKEYISRWLSFKTILKSLITNRV